MWLKLDLCFQKWFDVVKVVLCGKKQFYMAKQFMWLEVVKSGLCGKKWFYVAKCGSVCLIVVKGG